MTTFQCTEQVQVQECNEQEKASRHANKHTRNKQKNNENRTEKHKLNAQSVATCKQNQRSRFLQEYKRKKKHPTHLKMAM
jgi:hypothetical protein